MSNIRKGKFSEDKERVKKVKSNTTIPDLNEEEQSHLWNVVVLKEKI